LKVGQHEVKVKELLGSGMVFILLISLFIELLFGFYNSVSFLVF